MKPSWLVIACVVLMVSACGNKSGEESAAAKAAPPADETGTTKAADQAVQPVAEENTPEMKAPAVATSNMSTAAPPATAPAPKPAEIEKPEQASPAAQAGVLSKEEALALAGKSGCLACHRIETRLVGPAWMDVGKRYKGDPAARERLVAKVKAGGKGNWNDVTGGVVMPPNSPRVSDENIEKLVTFVLSL